MLSTRHLAAATIGALTLTLPQVSTHGSEVRVLSAVGMRQVMRDLGVKFEHATGYKLVIAFDNTGVMARRVASVNQSMLCFSTKRRSWLWRRTVNSLRVQSRRLRRRSRPWRFAGGADKLDISSPEAFRRTLLSAKSVARPSPPLEVRAEITSPRC